MACISSMMKIGMNNFIETLKIYRQKVFFLNARTRSA